MAERIAVVVPLREGRHDAAEQLLQQGPPFDLERAGLERYEVFLSDQEAIFVFDAAAASSLERLLADPDVWTSAAAWQECIAGPPRIAAGIYAWSSAHSETENLFFDATPGPGDSDGGDIYSP